MLVFGGTLRQRRVLVGLLTLLRSRPTVGGTLHGPDRRHQEQPDRFIRGLAGGGCERGGSFPPALVSRSSCTEAANRRDIHTYSYLL